MLDSLKSKIFLLLKTGHFAGNRSRRHFLFSNNRIRVRKDTSITLGNSVMRDCVFEVSGRNCRINIADNVSLKNCRFHILGNDCKVEIGPDNFFDGAWFWLEDAESRISIGKDNKFTGDIQLAAIEGTAIFIGNDNLFSRGIQISTGDSHSILDADSRQRINPSGDIVISNHVWVGMDVTICKGVEIGDNVIVGRKSVVTKSVEQTNVAVAGVPAKVVREGVDWDYNRI